MRKIFADIELVQESANTSVLITGESGTGKELIARAIHFGSARGEGAFIPVNCASMPKELAESLLFGHVQGAFTGADSDKIGFFEMAHEGTLFLDELGEMPLELQAKLLRVLEDGEVWPVGARQGKKVDVRVVAATNVDFQLDLDSVRRGLVLCQERSSWRRLYQKGYVKRHFRHHVKRVSFVDEASSEDSGALSPEVH